MTKIKFNPCLLEVPLYIGGKSIESVKREFGLEEVIKLASNESPIGPSPKAVEAARKALLESNRYPGVASQDMCIKLARKYGGGFTKENFLIGNGGTDTLRLLTQGFVFDGGNTVTSQATFPMYKIFTLSFGGTPVIIRNLPDYNQDLEGMLNAITDDTRLVFICSPNNPTGVIVTQKEADRFMERVPEHVIVVFDECYHHFVDDEDYADSLKFIHQDKNVISVRSFSKSSGLANLRVGYLIGREEIVTYLQHTLNPFHSSDIALAAASASLDDEAYYREVKRVVTEGRDFLWTEFTRLGLKSLPSQANFVTILDPPGGSQALVEGLLRAGIIVRDMGGFGLMNSVRVTVGTPSENAALIHVLEGIL